MTNLTKRTKRASEEIMHDKLHLPNVNDGYYSSNPKDHNKTFETWDELFEFQARKDCANYSLLKDWLKKYCEVPKLKNE